MNKGHRRFSESGTVSSYEFLIIILLLLLEMKVKIYENNFISLGFSVSESLESLTVLLVFIKRGFSQKICKKDFVLFYALKVFH